MMFQSHTITLVTTTLLLFGMASITVTSTRTALLTDEEQPVVGVADHIAIFKRRLDDANDRASANGDFCSVCPDGGPMEHPNRMVPLEDPSDFMTCDDLEIVLSAQSMEDCPYKLGSFVYSTHLWIPAFCGCEGETIPNQCSFCATLNDVPGEHSSSSTSSTIDDNGEDEMKGGQLSASQSPSPSLSSTTAPSFYHGTTMALPPSENDQPVSDSFEADICLDIATRASFVIDADFCETEVALFEAYCCPPPHKKDCSVCPHDHDSHLIMGNPQRKTPFSEGHTCQNIDDMLSSEIAPNLNLCLQARKMAFHPFDGPSFCGCAHDDNMSVIEPPSLCQFCSVESMPNPDWVVLDDGETTLTCRDAAEFAPYVADPATCTDLYYQWKRGCCRQYDDEDEDTRCHLCPDHVEMAFPTKRITLERQAKACSEMDFNLGFFDVDECSAFRDASPLDYAGFCGCSNATTYVDKESDGCSLCDVGYTLLEDEYLLGFNNTITCGQQADLASYIVDDQFCQQYIALFDGECCRLLSLPRPPLNDTNSTKNNETKGSLFEEDEIEAITVRNVIWLVPMLLIVGVCFFVCLQGLDKWDNDGPDLAGQRWREQRI